MTNQEQFRLIVRYSIDIFHHTQCCAALNVLRHEGFIQTAYPSMSPKKCYSRPGLEHLFLFDKNQYMRQKLNMPKVRIHDLRHAFAAVGATSGQSLPIIGAILGHREVSTTQRYAHLADLPVKQATNTIADKISDAMTGEASEPVNIDVAASVDKTQIVQLINNLQTLLKSA